MKDSYPKGRLTKTRPWYKEQDRQYKQRDSRDRRSVKQSDQPWSFYWGELTNSNSTAGQVYLLTGDDLTLMNKICTKWKIHWVVSPLCWNTWLYLNLKKISKEHWVSFNMMLSISYAESHIWANFNKPECAKSNNRWGIKIYKKDDWTYAKVKLPTADWCWLYPFATVEEYRNGLANTLEKWYRDRWCETASCISTWYVGTPWKVKTWWVLRVNSF
jgi:hypothetical protein